MTLAFSHEVSLWPLLCPNVRGSGLRATKAIYELHRIAGRYALVTMCIGGGRGIAAIFERILRVGRLWGESAVDLGFIAGGEPSQSGTDTRKSQDV